MAVLPGALAWGTLPIGGWGPTLRTGHLNPTTAAGALRLLKPRAAVAVHWGTLWAVGMGLVRRPRLRYGARSGLARWAGTVCADSRRAATDSPRSRRSPPRK